MGEVTLIHKLALANSLLVASAKQIFTPPHHPHQRIKQTAEDSGPFYQEAHRP